MNFNIIDTQAIYTRLLDTPDAATREAIFRDELIAPFAGLANVYGGSDPVQMFAQWGISADQFSDERRAQTRAVIDGLAAANGWERATASLKRARDAFAPYADRIPLESTTFGLIVGSTLGPADDEGYTGFGGIPGYIMTVYSKATPSNLERIEACTVHELHHNIWGTLNTKNFMTETTVGDYMIMEGLAESFAAELYGYDKLGPWVTAFDDTRLDETKATINAHLNDTGFNVIRGYIFGDLPRSEAFGVPKTGVPPYTGYALGYRVVQAYLSRHGGSVVDATFIPPEQLIAASGFFD
jgi:uncharacterized protein YjaZ